MKQVINLILISTIFLGAFKLSETPIDFYVYYIIYIVFIFIYSLSDHLLALNKNFLCGIVIIGGISIANVLVNGYPYTLVIKQLILILFSSSTYHLFIKFNHYQLFKIIKIYLNITVFVAVLGILQEILYLAGIWWINPAYLFKVSSIMSEPSHLVIALSPAFFIALNRLFDGDITIINKTKSYIIILAFCLTFSGVGFLGIIISIYLLLKKYQFFKFRLSYYSLTIVFIGIILTPLIYNMPFIKERVDHTWLVFTSSDKVNISELNLSSFAIYSNFLVAKESFLHNPVIGSGLGTHEINYDVYIDKIFPEDSPWKEMELNREDGNSLFIRLLSELGILGIIIVIWFLRKNYIKYTQNVDPNLWVINNGLFLFLVLKLIRFGNYTTFGFFLFVFLYYLSYKVQRSSLQKIGNDG